MTEQPLDNPAVPDDELDEEGADVEHEAAANRGEDPEGDPDAPDPGDLNEPPADEDPEPALNDDAGDDLADIPEGEDDGDTDLDDEPGDEGEDGT